MGAQHTPVALLEPLRRHSATVGLRAAAFETRTEHPHAICEVFSLRPACILSRFAALRVRQSRSTTRHSAARMIDRRTSTRTEMRQRQIGSYMSVSAVARRLMISGSETSSAHRALGRASTESTPSRRRSHGSSTPRDAPGGAVPQLNDSSRGGPAPARSSSSPLMLQPIAGRCSGAIARPRSRIERCAQIPARHRMSCAAGRRRVPDDRPAAHRRRREKSPACTARRTRARPPGLVEEIRKIELQPCA